MTQHVLTGIVGYETPIRKALWKRILHLGAPRMMSYTWGISCAWLGLMAFNKFGLRWTVAVAVLWLLVQIVLGLLTSWNVRWDNALAARWHRGYQRYYPAG